MLDQLNNLVVILCLIIVLLNPVLNCSKIVLSFSVDKVTTGTYNFT